MKDLLDIQREIRRLEDGIREIAQGLAALQEDLEEMRSTARTPETDYERIEMLSGQIRLEGHPLGSLQDERVCRLYLEMLLHIVRLDPKQELAERRLAWIQGLNRQAGTERTLEELYIGSLQIDSRSLDEFARTLPETYRECFLVDALVIANLWGCANGGILEYLAGLGEILGVTGKKLRRLSLFVRTVLCRSVSGMERADLEEILEAAENFWYYMEAETARRAVEELRHVAVKLRDEDGEEFRWKALQGQIVEPGSIIAVYKPKKPKKKKDMGSPFWGIQIEDGSQHGKVLVKAGVSGTLYQFRMNNTNYGVIGHRTDRKEAIKEWMKKGGDY